MKITKKGKAIISIVLILSAILILIAINTTGDLSCQIETAASCSNQGTILLYLQNDSGGYDNAHAENTSYATYGTSYQNILCCNSTNNTLTTFCGSPGATFLNISNETNAHVEDPNYDNYSVASCINIQADPTNMSCSIEPAGCPDNKHVCLASIASDGVDNKTNAHVSSCGVYDTQACCHVNTRVTVVYLNSPLNYSNFSTIPEFSWSNATDADNDIIYYLLEIDNNPLFPQPLSYSNVSIQETDNTTEDTSIGNSLTTEGHYFWRALATDLEDNSSAFSDVWFFTFDQTPPSVTITYPGNNSILYTKDDGTAGATLYINFTVDELPVALRDTIAAAWWINSSGTTNVTDFAAAEDVDFNTRRYAVNITDWGPDGEINFSVWANDSSGNEHAIDYFVYTILTESKPHVQWISSETSGGNPILVRNGFDILVNVTANATAGGAATINYTWLEVDYPNGTIVNLTMDNSSETEYFYNFTSDFPDGFYFMRTYANYTETGNEGTAGTVLYREIDNTMPNMTAADITVGSETFFNNSWSRYGDLTFNFAVSDNRTSRDGFGWPAQHSIASCNLTYSDIVGEGNFAYNISKDAPTIDADETIPLAGVNTLTDGNYNWTITCTDEIGNTGNDTRIKVINVDVTYPLLEFNTPSENQLLSNISNHPVINLTITDIISGVNHTWLEINNSAELVVNNESLTESLINNEIGTNATYAYDWNTLLYADDFYTITVYTNDSANNENATVRTVKVDNSGPNITIESPPNNSISGSEDQTFQIRAWDFSTITNCSLIINNEVNQTITSGILNYSLLSFSTSFTDGTYEWTANCTDEANNVETNFTTYTRTVDLTGPLINLTVPPDPLEFYLHNASINWSIEEPNIETNYTDVTMPNGTSIGRYFDNFTLSAQDNLTLLGTYPVSTYVKDLVGHEITSDTSFRVTDTIAPDVVIAGPENGTIQNSSDITFSFNTSDYHSTANCTLWINQTEGYTNDTITNDITVEQNINLTNITDEENVPWNITCYDESSNLNNTETALYINIDTTPPLIDFIEPTDGNNSYVSRNSTYINISVTEPHNDTVIIVWNYTTNYTSGIEEITITPAGGNIIFYEINITNLTEAVYEYYAFANDTLANESEGHSNTSEIRTIIIDETQPSAFDLLDPSNNAELTDDTPAFNWEDSTDSNFDNYSLEISTEENFATINTTSSNTISHYNLQESEALSSGIWYWRVKAIDKANNQRTSTSTFKFTISNVSLPTNFIIGPGGGGGGAGGKKIVYGVVSIIQPGTQTAYEGETITTPVIIQNTGDGPVRGITLKAAADSPAIKLDLSKAYIEFLEEGQQETIDLKITPEGTVGEYEITIKAEATDPHITDQTKFYVNLIGFGLGKKTITEEKLRFVGKLFESNPECLELRETVEEAKKELEEKDYDKSLEIIETAIKSCEELVKTTKKKVLEKPAEPKRTLQILIGEIISFIIIFIMIYRYYRKRAYKEPIMTKKKTGPALMLLILVFLGGFFMLKEYTGFTTFEDVSESDFNLGTHSNTETFGNSVRLTSGSTLGNFTSRIFNSNFTVEWQTINWSWASTTINDNVTIDVRTSFDNITWSSWSENVTNTSKIPDGKTVWTEEEDFIGTLTNTNITAQAGNITLNSDGSAYSTTGNFESEPVNLGFTGVNITTIEFTIINTSSEDNITIETSTSNDNTTWGDWSQTNTSGDQVFSTDNKYFKWRATLATNDTAITPALEDLTVNYERNSTYIQYRATLSTDDNTKTPSLEWVNITYEDASIPIFEFLIPTEGNGTYTTNNFTYVNFTITEPNNDSFYFWWNDTQYSSIDMNETAEIPTGINVYGINLTELTEVSYEYYIWANDTYGHENQTENFTITIDQTPPSSFNLLNPSDGNRSTDDTPFLLWEDSNDTNFDNYTVQFATDTGFSSIVQTYYNTSSNYQIQDSEVLPSTNGTFYWHTIAYDKAGQNYTTNYFTYYLGYQQTTTIAPGTAGEGGGGGKAVERRQVGLELIKPSALSFFANRQIIIPLLLVNTGTEVLQNIELTAESSGLEIELKNNLFPILRPNQEIDPQLVIKPTEGPGRYSIIVKAKVSEPEFTDAIMFIVDIVEFGLGNKTGAEEKLTFVTDFIKSHDECAELEKFVIEANEAFKKNEFDLVLSLTEQAVQSCKDLVSTAKEKKLEKRKRPTWQYYVPLLEGLLFLLIFSGIYSYYKRLKFKRRKYW